MVSVGKIVDGQFVRVAGDFDIANASPATETESGLMTPSHVKKLDSACTQDDIADEQIIKNLFKKGE